MTRLSRSTAARAGWAAGVFGLAALTLALATGTGRPGTAGPSATRASPAPTVPSGDGPSGFWYGTDSSSAAAPGPQPYREPATGGAYGGYVGMIGNWAGWQGCGGQVVWSTTDGDEARANFVSRHAGIGVAGYWFMAGPGVDPHYKGTTGEAYAWGAAQAATALRELPHTPTRVNYPVLFMDIELPGYAPDYTPAPDNGWNSVYTSACGGRVRLSHVPASLDRADVNGFAAYLTGHSAWKAGVYSAPSVWTSIFGTSAASASIPNTYEWTYEANTGSLSHHPYGWCLPGTSTCARFFGGQTSSSRYALIWQWSGGGGTRNGYGDFDQIDASRTP